MLTALWQAWNRMIAAMDGFSATLEQATAKLDGQANRVREALPGPDAAKELPHEGNGAGRKAKARV